MTSKWGLLILLALSHGPLRWSELRRMVDGLSAKMLTQSLAPLVDLGIIDREQKPTMPPHVVYSLTARGHRIAALLTPLVQELATQAGESLTPPIRLGA